MMDKGVKRGYGSVVVLAVTMRSRCNGPLGTAKTLFDRNSDNPQKYRDPRMRTIELGYRSWLDGRRGSKRDDN